MPLQNRVTPNGDIVFSSARGTLVGNRGCLHDGSRTLGRRRWTTRSWAICLLSFGGRRRELMRPGYYAMFVSLETTLLKRQGQALPWSIKGNGPAVALAPDREVTVLTPHPTVEALRAGCVPGLF